MTSTIGRSGFSRRGDAIARLCRIHEGRPWRYKAGDLLSVIPRPRRSNAGWESWEGRALIVRVVQIPYQINNPVYRVEPMLPMVSHPTLYMYENRLRPLGRKDMERIMALP